VGELNSGFAPVADLGAAAVQVVVDYIAACARLEDGRVRCWGRNEFDGWGAGYLGDGTNTDRNRPVTVVDLPAVVDLSMVNSAACAVGEEGGVYCWGSNCNNQQGDGYNHPGCRSASPLLISAE